MSTLPFPTILHKGRRVRATVGRLEPLYAVVEFAADAEPEITHVCAKRLALAYKRDVERHRMFRLGVRIKIVPLRWCLGDPTAAPKTLAEAFGNMQ